MNIHRTNPRRAFTPALIVLLALLTIAGKPRKPKARPHEPEARGPALPTDLNQASMRVSAVDTLYQLDLSVAQLRALATTADGVASHADRAAAKGNEKLRNAMEDLNRALLTSNDDDQIARLRNHLAELATADDVQLDDQVRPTTAALGKAEQMTRQFTAGQIAAYLASHADEVGGPVEKMVAALSALHDAPADQVDSLTIQVANEVSFLVIGDESKTADLAGKVAAWLKSNRDLTDEQTVARHDELEKSARKVVGDVAPMEILGHWMDNQTAILLSNPQLPDAIRAVLVAKERG